MNEIVKKNLMSLAVLSVFLFGFVVAGNVYVTDGDLDVDDDLNVSDVLFVDSINSRVGIGTSNPGYAMEVIGTGANPSIAVNRTDGATAWLSGGASWAVFGSRTNHGLSFQVNSSSVLTIGTDGNVGISDLTPAEKLDVNGNVRADDFIEYSEEFTGDALSILKNIETREAESDWKPVSHDSLPEEVVIEYEEEEACEDLDLPESAECVDLGAGKSIVYGRSLNDMVAIDRRALQQLFERVESLEDELCLTGDYSWC